MFGGDGKAQYGYDLFDNLVAAQLGNVSGFDYVYNARNQLSALTNPSSGAVLTSYSYDAQGNLAGKNSQVYQFDQGNRLRNVPGVASYMYDATGRRVQKTEFGTGTLLDSQYNRAGQLMFQWNPANQNATDYIYLGDALVARLVSNNSEVIGAIDGVSTTPALTVDGWACSTGIVSSISVELFVGGPSGQGTRIAAVTASQPSESAIAAQCQTNGTAYRFSIPLDTATRDQYGGKTIYMYGDSPVGNGNNALSGSGTYNIPPNPNAPQPPASISVPSTSSTGNITAAWAASSGATSYVLEQQLNGGAWTQVYSGSSTSQAINGLGGGTYMYRVEACNANGCSGFTTSGDLVVDLKPPMPSSVGVPVASSTGSVTVSWAASSGATSYVLQQQMNGGSWTQAYSGSTTSQSISGLGDGSYVYRVQACNANGCSDWGTSGTLTVALIPATPGSISLPTTSSTGVVTVSWASSPNATSYVLQQQFNGGGWTQAYSGGATSKAIGGLGNGSYVYRVEACNSNGCSAWQTSGALTVALVPAPSASISVPASSYSPSIGVSWSASTNATNYVLEERFNGGGWGVAWNGPATGTTVTVDASGTYQFQVAACGAGGCSDFTASGNVAVTLPPGASSLSGPSSSSTGTFTLTWTAVSGATSYHLHQVLSGADTQVYNGSARSWASNALMGGSYAYRVDACNVAGCGPSSNTVTVSVPAHAPAVPAPI
jgi:YD repeat-containing protein